MPTIERQGVVSVPITRRYPRVIGGVCEFHGELDNTKPADIQYTLCDHFKDIGQLRCSYCDESRSPEEVIKQSAINVYVHPDNPNKLVVVCDNFQCEQKHQSRFKLSKS